MGILGCLRKLHRYQLDYNSCVATNLPFFVVKAKSSEKFQESILSLLVFPRNLYYLFPESLYLYACFFTRESLVTEKVMNVRKTHPPTHYPSTTHTDRACPPTFHTLLPTQPPRRDVFTHRTDTFNKLTGDRCGSFPPCDEPSLTDQAVHITTNLPKMRISASLQCKLMCVKVCLTDFLFLATFSYPTC